MAKGRDEKGVSCTKALQLEMKALARRDMELWCIGILAMLVLLSGVLSVLIPRLKALGRIEFDTAFLPQLLCGLTALVVLLSLYLVDQRKVLHRKTEELIREVGHSAQLEKMAFIDPVTQLFTEAYLTRLLDFELKRANINGTEITFLALQIKCPTASPDDELRYEVAHILRSTFRGSDTAIHHGEERFLVVLPETTEGQAMNAVGRLLNKVDQWNLNTISRPEILLHYGLAAYVPGGDVRKALEIAEARLEGAEPNSEKKMVHSVDNIHAKLLGSQQV